MKSKLPPILLSCAIFFASCSSTTIIRSEPPGAKLYLNGEPVGVTPYKHRDTKIVGTSTDVKLELAGYETLNTYISRDEEADVGAIIGGIFVLVPFLWTMKYKPFRTFEMRPLSDETNDDVSQQINTPSSKSKTDRLRELKQMFEEKLITQEEYDRARTKILNEKD